MTDYSIRLTPGDAPGSIAEYRRVDDAYCHQIRLNGVRQVIPLSPAEALAFARQLPEVKALVQACHCAPLATIAHRVDVEGAGGDSVRRILDALVPFEEAPDAVS